LTVQNERYNDSYESDPTLIPHQQRSQAHSADSRSNREGINTHFSLFSRNLQLASYNFKNSSDSERRFPYIPESSRSNDAVDVVVAVENVADLSEMLSSVAQYKDMIVAVVAIKNWRRQWRRWHF
jgi:hypothetical protein